MRDYAFDITDALSAPILTHAEAWKDCIPQRLLKIIPMARMKALMTHEETATLPEVVAFIMTRTFEAPMDRDWTDIYTHVSCKVCEEYFGEDPWEAVMAPRELTQYVTQQLNGLRRHIYEKRRKLLKQEIKQKEKAA